ncbi:hypothetical protein ACSSV8_003931 [Roseovarius sp. MBR-79]
MVIAWLTCQAGPRGFQGERQGGRAHLSRRLRRIRKQRGALFSRRNCGCVAPSAKRFRVRAVRAPGARSRPTSAGRSTSPAMRWPMAASSAPPTSRTIAPGSARRSRWIFRCRASGSWKCWNAWPVNGDTPISWSWITARNCAGARLIDGLMITASSSISSIRLSGKQRPTLFSDPPNPTRDTPISKASTADTARNA